MSPMLRPLLQFLPILLIGGLIQTAITSAALSVNGPESSYVPPSEQSREIIQHFASEDPPATEPAAP